MPTPLKFSAQTTVTTLDNTELVPIVKAGNNRSTAISTVLKGAVQTVVYTSGAYPARPTGAPGGGVRYIGPVEPTTWLTNDEWVNNA